jgi:excisionase family DNA binding protein
MKKVYTTGEVAKLLGININTVIKWFDESKIDGFRLPGSRERRITHSALVSFMNTNGIPMDLIAETYPGPERRTAPRINTELPVQLFLGNEAKPAKVISLSESGALLKMDDGAKSSISLGDFDVEMTFGGKPLSGIKTSARIAHVRPLTGGVGVGLRFDSNNTSLREKIRSNFTF